MKLHGQAQADQMRMRTLIQNGIAEVSGQISSLESSLSPVATSGAYSDLSGKPTLGALAALDNITTARISDWASATSGFLTASSLTPYAKTADLATVATSGAYSDLSGTPTLATVATSGAYADLTGKPTIPVVPTVVSAFTNDAGYLTQHQSLAGYATENWVTSQGYLTQHQDISGKQDVLATEAVAITLPEVEELTTHTIVCHRYGNVVQVKISVTLSAALSSATTVATGLPAPAVELYDIVNTWTSSYRRPIRARITASGAMTFQYGYATSFNHVMTYLAA